MTEKRVTQFLINLEHRSVPFNLKREKRLKKNTGFSDMWPDNKRLHILLVKIPEGSERMRQKKQLKR